LQNGFCSFLIGLTLLTAFTAQAAPRKAKPKRRVSMRAEAEPVEALVEEKPEGLTTDNISISLVPVSKGRNSTALSVGPMLKSFPLKEIPPSLIDFRRYGLRVPIVYDPAVDVVPVKGQAGISFKTLGPDELNDDNVYMSVVIDDRRQCRDVRARHDKESAIDTYRVCVEVNDDSLDFVGGVSGPFRWLRQYGCFVQGGGSFLTQSFSQIAGSGSGVGDYFQTAGRLGMGAWWGNFNVELYLRSQLFTFTSADYKPLWVPLYLGYGWELPKFFGFVTPRLLLFTGFEYYRNRSDNVTNRFISDYRAPVFGFRTRFVLASRLETGGDFQYTFASGIKKFFVQGDLRYWFTPKWALGGGYWVDIASVSQPTSNFSESSFAAEGYIRYSFGGDR